MLYLFHSPLGPISYRWDGEACQEVSLSAQIGMPESVDPVSEWLNAYFSNQQAPLPLLAEAATPFQERMRQGLLAIPFGEVRTYGEIAVTLHTAPRAMGQALGANPLPILIPCHRIIAADGLGGFSCGLEWKKKLLKFERGF